MFPKPSQTKASEITEIKVQGAWKRGRDVAQAVLPMIPGVLERMSNPQILSVVRKLLLDVLGIKLRIDRNSPVKTKQTHVFCTPPGGTFILVISWME